MECCCSEGKEETILVEGKEVGIARLDRTLEEATDSPDPRSELLRSAKVHNYRPSPSEGA